MLNMMEPIDIALKHDVWRTMVRYSPDNEDFALANTDVRIPVYEATIEISGQVGNGLEACVEVPGDDR